MTAAAAIIITTIILEEALMAVTTWCHCRNSYLTAATASPKAPRGGKRLHREIWWVGGWVEVGGLLLVWLVCMMV
jgi:hypothetical protein